MATINRENLGVLHDKITVTLSKEDYYPSFEKAIREYSKKANIPGFRKGMVPSGMVKKMHGPSIYYDEVIKVVEKELGKYLNEEKPDIFAQPLPLESDMRSIDMNSPGEYTFPFEIGLKPAVPADLLKKAAVTFHKVKVTDDMINKEIERLQLRHGKMTDPETVTWEDNVLNVSFQESDGEGNVKEGGAAKDNSLLVKYFSPTFREKLMGAKKDDHFVLKLDEAFDEKEREWITGDLGLEKNDPATAEKFFRMLITKVGLVERRELNEEFFNEVFPEKGLKTEADFREQIAAGIQAQWDAQSRVQLHDQIYHILVDTPMELPGEFLKHWMQKGGEKVKSPEEAEAEFPNFSNQLKWTLISNTMIKANNLQVSKEELREHMRMEIMQYFGQMNMGNDTAWMESYIDRMMKDEKQVESSYHRLITDKLFKWAETQVTPNEKEVTPEELAAMQHHHHH